MHDVLLLLVERIGVIEFEVRPRFALAADEALVLPSWPPLDPTSQRAASRGACLTES